MHNTTETVIYDYSDDGTGKVPNPNPMNIEYDALYDTLKRLNVSDFEHFNCIMVHNVPAKFTREVYYLLYLYYDYLLTKNEIDSVSRRIFQDSIF